MIKIKRNGKKDYWVFFCMENVYLVLLIKKNFFVVDG